MLAAGGARPLRPPPRDRRADPRPSSSTSSSPPATSTSASPTLRQVQFGVLDMGSTDRAAPRTARSPTAAATSTPSCGAPRRWPCSAPRRRDVLPGQLRPPARRLRRRVLRLPVVEGVRRRHVQPLRRRGRHRPGGRRRVPPRDPRARRLRRRPPRCSSDFLGRAPNNEAFLAELGIPLTADVAAVTVDDVDARPAGDPAARPHRPRPETTRRGRRRAVRPRGGRAGVAAVCVWPRFVGRCADRLAGTGVKVATVVNFPAGTDPADAVAAVTAAAVAAGADEIDVVLPYPAWLAGDIDARRSTCSAPCAPRPAPLTMKVIIETGELPDRAAIDRATHFAIASGADFVKTSTGKTPVSATPEAAEIVLEAIDVSGRPVGFKASGGIRTLADARTYLDLADDDHGPRLGDAGDVPLRRQRPARRPRGRRRRRRAERRGPAATSDRRRTRTERRIGAGEAQRVERRGGPRRRRGTPSSIDEVDDRAPLVDGPVDELGGLGVADDRVQRRGQGRRPLGVARGSAPRRPRCRRRTARRTPGTRWRAACPTRTGRRPSPAGTCSARGCPATRRSATVASLPKTRAATWFTDSHSTGLTLPGMIDEPACSSGSSSSASPADGPLGEQPDVVGDLGQRHGDPAQPGRRLGQRALPALLHHRVGARPQRQPGLGGERGDDRRRRTPAGALIPVPTAVPPSGSSPSTSTSATRTCAARRASIPAHASASCPSVTGVASIRCVRPALTTWAKRVGHVVEARRSSACDRRVDVVDELAGDGDADRRRHRVVRRLRRVDVVVRVDVAAERRRPAIVGQHLVDVHVRRRARAGLVHVDGNWSSSSPASTRRAASPIAAATSSSTPATSSEALTTAAWRLIAASAWATRTSSGRWAIGKLPTARSVCFPQQTFPCRSPYGRPAAVVQCSRCALRATVRRRPVRPRRRPHPHRRHPPAGVDEDVRRVPRPARAGAVHRRRLPRATSTANRASTASARSSPPATSRCPEGDPSEPPGDGSVSRARQPQERRVPDDPARRRDRAVPRLGALPRPPGDRSARRSPWCRRRATRARCSRRPDWRHDSTSSPTACSPPTEHIAGKPAPDLFLAAADRLGVAAAEGGRRRGRRVRRRRRAGRRLRPRRRRRPRRRSRRAACQRCRRRRRRSRRAAGRRPMRRDGTRPPRPAPLPDRPVAPRRARVRRRRPRPDRDAVRRRQRLRRHARQPRGGARRAQPRHVHQRLPRDVAHPPRRGGVRLRQDRPDDRQRARRQADEAVRRRRAAAAAQRRPRGVRAGARLPRRHPHPRPRVAHAGRQAGAGPVAASRQPRPPAPGDAHVRGDAARRLGADRRVVAAAQPPGRRGRVPRRRPRSRQGLRPAQDAAVRPPRARSPASTASAAARSSSATAAPTAA